MSVAERRGLWDRRSTLLGCSSSLAASSFKRSPPSRPRCVESATRPASFCASRFDALAMPQSDAHGLSTTGSPSPGSLSAVREALPGIFNCAFFYLTSVHPAGPPETPKRVGVYIRYTVKPL